MATALEALSVDAGFPQQMASVVNTSLKPKRTPMVDKALDGKACQVMSIQPDQQEKIRAPRFPRR